jgi:TRAP-type C4-dicarboxylate transport system permease small subunit
MNGYVFFPLILGGLAAFQEGITGAGTNAGVNTGVTVGAFIGIVVQAVLQIIGVVFFILMLYGGFKWMSSSGQQKQIEEAQKIITHSIIGLIVVILAYAISMFIVSSLQKAI